MAQTGGAWCWRSCGASETARAAFRRSEHQKEQQPAPEKRYCPASRGRSRRTGKAILEGGEAAGGEEEAKGRKVYLFPRLSRPPDVSGSRGRRWSPSGRCGCCRLLARAGVDSGRSSGASQVVRRKLQSSAEDSADLGSQMIAGDQGGCSLLLR